MASSHLELAVAATKMFAAHDSTLDEREVERLLRLAFEDGQLDADEKRVLAEIFDRVDRARVAPEVWHLITITRQQFNF